MATGIDRFNTEKAQPACDPREACCPEAEGEGPASFDTATPAGAAAAFAAAMVGGDIISKGSDLLRSAFTRAFSFFANRPPFGEAPQSVSAKRWFEELPPERYMSYVNLIGERLEGIPSLSGMKGRDLHLLVKLSSDNIIAVVSHLEGEPWFVELPEKERDGFRQRAISELRLWMGWKSFIGEKFSSRGKITVDGAAHIARMTSPIEPIYPPAGKGKFDPYAPLDPSLELIATKLAEVLTSGDFKDLDPQEGHRRAAWALLEAQRIFKSQPWAKGLSVGERDALFHELKTELLAALSSPERRGEAQNPDGYVKIGFLKKIVAEMKPPQKTLKLQVDHLMKSEKGEGAKRRRGGTGRLRGPSYIRK